MGTRVSTAFPIPRIVTSGTSPPSLLRWYLAMEASAARFPVGEALTTGCKSWYCWLVRNLTLTGHSDNGFFDEPNG